MSNLTIFFHIFSSLLFLCKCFCNQLSNNVKSAIEIEFNIVSHVTSENEKLHTRTSELSVSLQWILGNTKVL